MNAVLLSATLMAGPAPAAPITAAETYTIDATHSMALFRVKHQGAGAFWGRFNSVTGTITHDENDEAGLSFDVAIEVASVDTGNANLDGHLKSEDFFHVEAHPQLTFKSTAAKRTKERLYEVTGDLTMRGVTRRVTVPVEWIGTAEGRRGKKCGFEAVFTVKRSEYEISYGVEGGALGDETRLVVAMEAGAGGGRGGARRGGGDAGGGLGRMAAFDANGDGKLQKDELPERMQGRFDEMDADGDGAVTAEELRAMRGNRGGGGGPASGTGSGG